MDELEGKPIKGDAWIEKRWRPIMAFTYVAICIFDFIAGPIINYIFFAKTGVAFNSWKPLTMSDGGLFHISMGTILGIAAWTRGKEKVERYRRRDYRDEYDGYGQGYGDRSDYRDRLSRKSSREDR